MDIFTHMQTEYFKDIPATESAQELDAAAEVKKATGLTCVKTVVNNAVKTFWGKLKTFFLRNKDKEEATDAQELFGFGKKEEDKAAKYRKDPNAAVSEILAWMENHRKEIEGRLANDEMLVDVGDDKVQKLNASFAMDIKEKSWEHGSPLIALQFNQHGKPVAILGIMKANLANPRSHTVSYGYLTTIYDGVDLRHAVQTDTWPPRMNITLVYYPLWTIDNPGVVEETRDIVIVGGCEYTINR